MDFSAGVKGGENLPNHSPGCEAIMESEGSISCWLDQLKDGNHDAVHPLWERYFVKLVLLARKLLANKPRLRADAEDVAISVFDSLCRNASIGRFPQLFDRGDLWRVLAVITARKAMHLARDEGRQKRGGL